MSSYQEDRSVTLTAPAAMRGLQLARLSAQEQISRPFRYELELVGGGSPLAAADAERLLGQLVTVTVNVRAGAPARHFNGVIAEFAHVGYGARLHRYQVVLRPAFWMLSRRADCRIFQNLSTVDVFTQIARAIGDLRFRLELAGQYAAWEYRVQYRESDFDFVSRLLEHEGIYYYFEHSVGQHFMVLTDEVGKLSPAEGYAEVPYFPAGAAGQQRERDHLRHWAVHSSFEPAAFATTEYNFETPSAPLISVSPVAGRGDANLFEIFDYPARPQALTSAVVESLAKARAQRLQTSQSVTRAQGDAAGLAAGRVFTLTGYPETSQNRKYLITASTCELTTDAGQSDGTAGSQSVQLAVTIEAAVATVPYRPERLTPKPCIHGTQTARVVGGDGQEVTTDTYGRVKVQFHWDRASQGNEQDSCWVRVAQSWAGKNWGTQYVPRVGQEVVVSFLEGDPDRPLIIGSLYNAEQMPPYALPNNHTQSGVKTRSLPDGTAEQFNELRFEDKKGSEHIYFHAEKDMQVVVENDQTITVGAVKKDKGDRTTTIHNDDSLTVGNDLTRTVNGKETRTVTKARTTTVKEDDALDVTKKYTLTAGEQITLEVGQAKIVMKKDGTIEISGGAVKLSGTQKAEIDAPQTAVSGTQIDIKGTKTAVQGSGTLDLASSGIATLKGTLTKIG